MSCKPVSNLPASAVLPARTLVCAHVCEQPRAGASAGACAVAFACVCACACVAPKGACVCAHVCMCV